MILCGGSLLLIPIYFLAHPAASQMAHGFVTPVMPGGSGQLATVMLLVIGIVGTTVAPWQLFFQQSYVIDKRITPRFIRYEKADLWIGIVVVILGAGAIMGFTAAAFAGHAGEFTNAADLAAGLQAHAGRVAGVLFAVALLDASIIGAFAVSLSTAYAIGDVFGLKHSLHRGVKGAKGFYAIYGGLVLAAAAVVLIPGSPLGLLTEGVQALAGVLLPSAAVYLLLLCNDREVLGPWVNGRRTNLFTGSVVTVLVALSRHPDRVGARPGPVRPADPDDPGRLHRRRGPGRAGLRGPPAAARRPRPGPGRGDRPRRPGELADAAAGAAAAAAGAAGPQDRHDRAVVLPGRRDGPGRREDRPARPGALTALARPSAVAGA